MPRESRTLIFAAFFKNVFPANVGVRQYSHLYSSWLINGIKHFVNQQNKCCLITHLHESHSYEDQWDRQQTQVQLNLMVINHSTNQCFVKPPCFKVAYKQTVRCRSLDNQQTAVCPYVALMCGMSTL